MLDVKDSSAGETPTLPSDGQLMRRPPQGRHISRADDATPDTERGKSTPRSVYRVVTLPLVTPTKQEYEALKRIAGICANFGNRFLTEKYTKARGLKGEHSVFVDFNEELSSVVRLGVCERADGAWSRAGKRILAGHERLALFSSRNGIPAAVHQGGGFIERRPEGFVVSVRLLPKTKGVAHEFLAYQKGIDKQRYLTDTLDRIAVGEYVVKKITIRFEKRWPKISAQLAYVKTITAPEAGSAVASIELEAGERLVVRCGQRARHFTDRYDRIAEMRAKFGQITQRLSESLGKARRWHDQRRALRKRQSFAEWAEGPVHELSRHVVDWAREQGAGAIEWRVEDTQATDGQEPFPWATLRWQTKYKADEAGLQFVDVRAAAVKRAAKPAKEGRRSRLGRAKRGKTGDADGGVEVAGNIVGG